MKSLILLNKNIKDYNIFKESILDNHNIINYDENINIDDIIKNNINDNIIDITHLTLIYHHNPNKIIPFFDYNFDKFKYISNELFEFFKFIKNNSNISTIDLLTCFVNSEEIINEISIIKNELNIDIRYSESSIGCNNWLLTSHDVDIKNLYFNDNIDNWNNTLGQITLFNLSNLYPSIISRSGQYYKLMKDIILPDDIPQTRLNFSMLDIGPVILQNGDIFDGNNYTITCKTLNNGIFTTPSNNSNTSTIKNLTIRSNGHIAENMGGFIPSHMAFVTITDCVSICPNGLGSTNSSARTSYSGGFVGKAFGYLLGKTYPGNGIIQNCKFIGDITGNNCGGIAGSFCGNRGDIIIQNCSMTGNIISGHGNGGICGFCAGYNGNLIINKCFSSAKITGFNSGGIVGQFASTINNFGINQVYTSFPILSRVLIQNSYSTGDIQGPNSGGITGSYFAGIYDGPSIAGAGINSKIESCWSSGEIIGNNCGGITGPYTNNNSSQITNSVRIEKCYSLSKNIKSTNSGGICGPYISYGNDSYLIIKYCYTIGEIGPTNGGIIGAYSRGGLTQVNNCIAYNINNSGIVSTSGGGIIGPNSTTLNNIIECCAFNAYDNNNFSFVGLNSNSENLQKTYKSLISLRYSNDFLDNNNWVKGSGYNDIYPRLKNFTIQSDPSYDDKYITNFRTPNYYFSGENSITFLYDYSGKSDNKIIELRDWMIYYIFDKYNITGFEINKDSMGINNITNSNKEKYVSDKYIIYKPNNNINNPVIINPYGSESYKGVYCPLVNVNDIFYFKSSDSNTILRSITKIENDKYLYSEDLSNERDTYYTYMIDKLRLVLGGICIIPLLLKPIKINNVITTPNVTLSTLTTQINFINDETNASGYRIINYYYDKTSNSWIPAFKSPSIQWYIDTNPSLSTVTDTNWIGFNYDGKLYGYRVIALGDGINWFDSYEYYPVVQYNYPYLIVNSTTPQIKDENISTVIIDNGEFTGKYITAGITIDSIELSTPTLNLITKNDSNHLILSWNSVDATQYLIKRYYYVNNKYVFDKSFIVNNITSYIDISWDLTKNIIAYTITAKGNESSIDSKESLKMPYFNNSLQLQYSKNTNSYIIIADILCEYSLIDGIKTLLLKNNTKLKKYFSKFSGTELSNKRSQAFSDYFKTFGQNDVSLHIQKKLLNFGSNYKKSLYKVINYNIIKSTYGFIKLSNYNFSSYGVYIPLYDNYSEIIFYINDDIPDSTSTYYRLTKYIKVYNNTDVIYGLDIGNINENYFIPNSDFIPYYLNNNVILNRYNLIFGGLTFDDRGPIPCLTENTDILTSSGYKNIKDIKVGDYIITPDYRKVQIKNIHINIVKGNLKNYPYIVEKNSIAPNYPIKKFTISGDHLIKYKNKWLLPKKIPYLKQDISKKIIKYYHIELENYETDHLIINNGTIVESFGCFKKDIKIYLNRIKNNTLSNIK